MLNSLNLPLVDLALSALLALGIVVRLLAPNRLAQPVASRIAAMAFGGVASLLVVVEIHIQTGPAVAGPVSIPAGSLAFVGVTTLASGLFLSTKSWWRDNVSARHQPILWGMLAVAISLGLWSYRQVNQATGPHAVIAMDRMQMGQLHEVEDAYAETDLGRPIELLKFEVDGKDSGEVVMVAPQRHGGVKRGAASDKSNCHGWVFTGGQHCVSGEMVPRILEDNGYELVTDPQPGDLIVYFDDEDFVLHSGIVRSTLEDGIVLIESKFGVGARFLHMPEDQPYSTRYEYYRSGRGGHLITMRSGRPPHPINSSHRRSASPKRSIPSPSWAT